ncbi:MAG: hypothetical protein ACO1QS_11350 [Verrucomicrobiota bacterium]
MELKTFISQALLDIMAGVKDAQLELYKNGGRGMKKAVGEIATPVAFAQTVDFEVSVRAEETHGSGAKIGVVAGFFGGNVEGKSDEAKGHVATLKFSVPVRFPLSDMPD